MNVRRDRLEDDFRSTLERLSVAPDAMRLYEEVVRDAWKRLHGQILERQEGLRGRLRALEEHERRLVDAYVYQGKISEDRFERESERLRSDMDLAFAKKLLCNPAEFWDWADHRHRPRIQRAVYPNGLRLDGELVGTADTSLVFG